MVHKSGESLPHTLAVSDVLLTTDLQSLTQGALICSGVCVIKTDSRLAKLKCVFSKLFTEFHSSLPQLSVLIVLCQVMELFERGQTQDWHELHCYMHSNSSSLPNN